ncbi:MAG: serine/threonine-protein kinase, partial [Pseudomonadota bacterium]
MQRKEVIDLGQYRAASHVGSVDTDGQDGCALRTGTKLLHGQYTLTEFLAAGGFGMTYVARDSLSRTVVIKECFPTELCVRAGTSVTARSAAYADGYQTLLDQFVAEAHCLAQLKHRNIVHVHQVFKENGTAYMAMDYVDGVDLCQIIDARARQALPPKEIVRIALRILHAIRYVHGSGMLHLDISPDNILIDRKGEPVLIDFGAARTGAASAETVWPLGCVKDGYSPPEFYIPHRERGAWSDLYSLGASLYHLMSGE